MHNIAKMYSDLCLNFFLGVYLSSLYFFNHIKNLLLFYKEENVFTFPNKHQLHI